MSNFDRETRFNPPWDQPRSYCAPEPMYRSPTLIYGHGNFHLGACEHCGCTLTNAVLGKMRCTAKAVADGEED